MHSGELEIDDKILQNVLEKINKMVNDMYSTIHDKDVKNALDILVEVC